MVRDKSSGDDRRVRFRDPAVSWRDRREVFGFAVTCARIHDEGPRRYRLFAFHENLVVCDESFDGGGWVHFRNGAFPSRREDCDGIETCLD